MNVYLLMYVNLLFCTNVEKVFKKWGHIRKVVKSMTNEEANKNSTRSKRLKVPKISRSLIIFELKFYILADENKNKKQTKQNL